MALARRDSRLRSIFPDRRDRSLVNQQLSLAGWALAAREHDDRVHGGVHDVLFAERASKGMVVTRA
jgi:hypothetical protein